ncbi:MAG: hypothetical protein P0116_13805 [Candidatus Nitrosocosmicus sp.]|nr:hypothetical protein [Candidatus Nitrosocosmicus sp.]
MSVSDIKNSNFKNNCYETIINQYMMGFIRMSKGKILIGMLIIFGIGLGSGSGTISIAQAQQDNDQSPLSSISRIIALMSQSSCIFIHILQ